MTTIPTLAAPAWGSIAPAGPHLWRVQEHRGRILGHVRVVTDEPGAATRYRAERFHPATRAFRTLGEFRSAYDAMNTLRG